MRFDSYEKLGLSRAKILRILLVVYSAGSIVIALPLAFSLAYAGNLAATTSGKILAAALLALAFGAVVAARDPWQHRLVIQIIIVFMVLAAVSIAIRLLIGAHPNDPARPLLPIAVAGPVLFAIFYPQPPDGGSPSS